MNDGIRRRLGIMLAMSVLLLAGCVSPGIPGGTAGGGYGQPGTGYPSTYGRQLLGTVDAVDTRYGRILLLVDDPRSGRGERREVRYDQRTRLFYQGREHAVEGLERGDVIRVEVADAGREPWAQTIEVVRNVRDTGYGGGYRDDGYGRDGYDDRDYDDRGYDDRFGAGPSQELSGQVAFVDERAQLISLDRVGYRNATRLRFDSRTTVEFQGRSYRPENLERGDQVRVQVRPLGNNEWLAERILVERSAGY